MNNAKMWLVVPPAVGVPVFLGAVAVGSFAVHVAVLSNTSWVADFLSGQPLGTGDQTASATLLTPGDVDTAKAKAVMPLPNGAKEVLITMPDGSTVRAVIEPNAVMASADGLTPLVAD